VLPPFFVVPFAYPRWLGIDIRESFVRVGKLNAREKKIRGRG
jgi:hypothetical protein